MEENGDDDDDDEKQNQNKSESTRYLYHKLLEKSESESEAVSASSALFKIGPLTVLANGMAPIDEAFFNGLQTRPRSNKEEDAVATNVNKTPSLAPFMSIDESMVLSYDTDDEILKANSLTSNFLKRERDTTMKFSENLLNYKDDESAMLSDIFEDLDKQNGNL